MLINKKLAREHLLRKNIINRSRPKDFSKNTNISSSYPHKAKIACRQPKVKLFRSEDPYDKINPMENTNYDTHIINVNEEHIREDAEEE